MDSWLSVIVTYLNGVLGPFTDINSLFYLFDDPKDDFQMHSFSFKKNN